MKNFNEYFLMNETDVLDYVKEKTDLFSDDSDLESKEIGDGNLNYVFRVVDVNSDVSVIVKQAGEVTRISEDMRISIDRIRIESNILKLQGKHATGLVPKVYLYDDVMNCFLMEDLSDHEIMREGLLSYKIYPKFADHITTFMVNTLLPTTDVVMDHKEKKELLKSFINPDLCEISEELVYTEPFNDYNNRNLVFEDNKEWVEKNIYNDSELKLEVAKLKFAFMNNAQALIHGDLHTGSVFITEELTKVIDPEFAFYGPMGYDVGNVIANLIFAYMNGYVNDKKEFIEWLEKTIEEVVDKFKSKFVDYWKDNVSDIMAKEAGFMEWYLSEVLKDTAGVAGLELSRRIIGMAQVKDITSIEDTEYRLFAERVCLSLAKELIINRDKFNEGKHFTDKLKENVNKYSA
ncbi:S-methyl-5-thioribose kinase [Alkalibacterium iburiense]|uniref:S-methyl-5-thioribose kinase n=1 Tax=Alkalibacterium iburiense TaxID=290589 RepID=A0ABP3GVH0_9LACT